MATPKKFEFHPEAISEIREAIAWYRERDLGSAQRFRTELKRAEKLITTRPRVWPDYMFGAKRYVLQKFPFSLIYIDLEDRIIGLAVAHSRRKPGYWESRV